MIRSFASGILVGGLVSALALAGFSLLGPPSGVGPTPAAAPVATTTEAEPAPTEEAPPATDGAPAEPAGDAPAGAVTPEAPKPAEGDAASGTGQTAPETPAPSEPATVVPTPEASTGPSKDDGASLAPEPDAAETPATAPTEIAEETPTEPAAAPVVAEDAALPVAPEATQNAAPAKDQLAAKDAAPVAEPAVTGDAVPPAVATTITSFAPAPTDTPPTAPPAAKPAIASPVAPSANALADPAPEAAPVVPAAPVAPPKIATMDAPLPVTPPKTEEIPAVTVEATPIPAKPTPGAPLPEVLAEGTLPTVDLPPPPAEKPKPRILTEDAPIVEAGTETLKPAPRLDSDVEGVVTDRLPRIGSDTAPAADGTVAEAADETPLVRFARDFENTDKKPVFSIILIDTGDAELNRQSLAELPFPVSFAIDPMVPDAAARAAIYRAAGQEVLMLATGIPEGATAADLEVSFAALADRLPEAVAVLEQANPVFQDNRPLATQVVPILAAQGRGLVTWDAGLNAADQVARREGLPSATAFRNLDAEGESVETVRRYLDRAAFRAAQDGRVVVIGTTRAETVEALIAWGLEGRSATVALAPISAALSME